MTKRSQSFLRYAPFDFFLAATSIDLEEEDSLVRSVTLETDVEAGRVDAM